jgi:hypothetical protein
MNRKWDGRQAYQQFLNEPLEWISNPLLSRRQVVMLQRMFAKTYISHLGECYCIRSVHREKLARSTHCN